VKKLAEEIYVEVPRRGKETSRRCMRPQELVSPSSERTVSVKTGGVTRPAVVMAWRFPSWDSGVEGETVKLST